MRAKKELETGATGAKTNERELAEWCLGASDRTARQIGQDRPGKENIPSGDRTAKRRLLVERHPGRDIGATPVVSRVICRHKIFFVARPGGKK